MTENNAAHDLGTSSGGRAYIAEYFATHLRRHDFAKYINSTLAADFACALAQHLSKLRAEGVQAGDERQAEHIETLQRMRADYNPSDGPMSELKATALDAAIAALASAPVAGAAQPTAYLTLDEEGSPCMLFFDVVEARTYCAPDEEPEPLFRHAAPQASEAVRNAALEVVRNALDSAIVHPCDENDDEARAITLYGPVRKLYDALKTQADKDGGDCAKGAGDKLAPVFQFLLGEGPLRGVHFGDRHPDERGAYWWRKDLRNALAAQKHPRTDGGGHE